MNLLGNAVKFTEAGEIRLDVRVEEEGAGPEGGIVLRFTVMDSGIGLQADACARIFDAFAQADPSTTRKYGGTGLGLAISRQIVRLMDGDIHVHSTPGEGATFWFTARFEVGGGGGMARQAEEAAAVAPAARPLRILVAEDNTINQLVLSEQLNKLGHTCMTVQNGVEALEALEKCAWDAVLMDCQMPVMDGYETVEAIRRAEEAEEGSGHTWVVAVTANALDGEREACLRAGMDDFLSKPFQVQQLAQVIARIPVPEGETAASRPVIDLYLRGWRSPRRPTGRICWPGWWTCLRNRARRCWIKWSGGCGRMTLRRRSGARTRWRAGAGTLGRTSCTGCARAWRGWAGPETRRW